MYKLLLFFLALSPFLCSVDAKVELVSIYPFDTTSLTQCLAQKSFDKVIVGTDLRDYQGLEKNRTLWTRLLKKCGIQIISKIPLHEGVFKIVFFNIDVHFRRDLDLKKFPKEKLILFMWEPPNALRKMYGSKVKECFSKIYTWDDNLVDNQTYFKFYYPALQPMIDSIPSFEEKKLCTLVSSYVRSKRPNSLYEERTKAVAFFEKIGERGFEFYGKGWDSKQYPSYRGPIKNKIDVIKNYRFSICYENTHNIKGYVTEKIFDCFAAGSVPIYWGASNIESYVPKECFIDRRNFKDLNELYAFLKDMPKKEYEAYLTHIRSYLKSEQAKLFSLDTFAKIFLDAVVDQPLVKILKKN